MLKQKEITVAGQQWVIEQLPATRGLEVLGRLSLLLAGSARGLGNLPDDAADMEIDIGAAAEGLLERLGDPGVPAFIKALVRESVKRPEMADDTFETTFSGNYGGLLDVLISILEHNYADLVEAAKKKARGISALFAPRPSPASSTPS